MNRLLTEGRQAFLWRLSGIERGAHCARSEPLLSALADGGASTEQLAILRPHMRTCLSCRARLREFRATRARVAALVPPAALVASDGGGPLHSLAEPLVGLGHRFHAAAELAAGQKIAAVAASAAALAGGGTAIDEFANHQGPPPPEPVRQVEAQPVKDEVPVEPPHPPTTLHPPTRRPPIQRPDQCLQPSPSRSQRRPTRPPSSHRGARRSRIPRRRRNSRRRTRFHRRAPDGAAAGRPTAVASSPPSAVECPALGVL